MAKTPEQNGSVIVRIGKAGKKGLRAARSRVTAPIAIGIVVLVVACGAIGFLTYDRLRLQRQVTDLSQATPKPVDETVELTNKIGALIELPTDETPTVATVTDVTKVQDKPFFTKAQNGDKVLLYAKSGKALLYRPATNKLIEVSTLNLESDTQATTPAPTPTKNKQ